MEDAFVEDAPPAESEERSSDSKPYGDRKVPLGILMRRFTPGSRNEQSIAKHHLAMWKAQDGLFDRPMAQWGVNAARRAGIATAKLVRSGTDPDDHWTTWLPRNASPDATPGGDKAATLCRRLVSQMYVDPPIAEVSVPDGDDVDEAAAELSQRALHSLQDEHGLNEIVKQRRAFSRSLTYASAYIEYYVNQQGGGQRYVEIEARADAEHAQLAFVDPMTGEEGPQLDPATGQPMPYQKRMVDERGFFVTDAEEAAVEYLPKLESCVHDQRFVRLLPHTADDIWEADAVMICSFPTWAEVQQMAPGISELPKKIINEILAYRPNFAEDMVDPTTLDIEEELRGQPNPERPVFMLKSYHLRCPEYPDGAMVITVGGKYVLHQSEWVDRDEDTGRVRPLSLPVTQMAGLEEGRDGYWRVALMELIGPQNEVRARQIMSWLDHLDRFGTRKTYIPTNSTIDPSQLRNPRLTHIPINPGGQPVHEQVPNFPTDGPALYEEMGRGMDEAAGIRETSGPNSKANVKSGRHEFALLSQVHAGLSEFRQNIERAFIRSSRITLELARAFLREEQQARWAPEGGGYRLSAWRGADLAEDPVIRIKPGSLTMLAPAAKAQFAERYLGVGVVDQDTLADVITSNISPQVGMQDNPHRLRIRGQIEQWREGPPDGWQPQPPQMDPMSGQPMPAPDPVLGKIFEPVPADSLPPVAAMRLKEISDAMANPKYLTMHPGWRAGLDMEYQRMGMTLQQHQMAQAGVGPAPGGQEQDQGDEGLVNKDGTQLNDLQEDALQEGADPAMVV